MTSQWEDIIKDKDFQDLPPAGQQQIRALWFDNVAAPELRGAGIDDENLNAYRQEATSSFDNGQGYISSFASSLGRGAAGAGTGLIGGIGAITGSNGLRKTADELDATLAEYLPVNPSLKYTNLAGNAIGQAGVTLATGGVFGAAGKAAGGIAAGKLAAQAGVLGTGGISEARGAADEADQYGITNENRALKIASSIFTGTATEFIPFGLGAELRGVKNLLGAGERVVGKRVAHVVGDLISEPVEETIGQIGNNAATAALAPAGTKTPDLMSGTGDAAFGGGAGGLLFAGFNAAVGDGPSPKNPRAAGSAPPAALPPPAGFTDPATPAAPTAPGIAGRASVTNPATPGTRPDVLTDAELAAMEAVAPPDASLENTAPPADSASNPVDLASKPADSVNTDTNQATPANAPPQAAIAITAAAIAASATPDVEAAVIETARIAADLNAQKAATPPLAETPLAETPAPEAPAPSAGIPVAESQPPAPEIAPASPASPAAEARTDLSPIAETPPAKQEAIDSMANTAPAPAPAAVQKPKPKPKASSRRFESDPAAYPLVSAIVEAGISPRNPAAELARARANRRENLTSKQQTLLQRNGGYNDVPTVKEFAGRPRAQDAIRKMLRNGSQNTPDVAVQQAAEFAGRDPQEFYGNTAWQEIREELMKLDDDVAAASKEDERMDAMEQQAVEFYAAIGEGKYQVDVTTLEPGDTLIVEGETVKVKKVNRDKNGDIQSVELQDGTKFGRQEIDPTTALFVEEFTEDPTDATPDVQVNQATLSPEPGRGQDVPESRNLPVVPAEPAAQGEADGTAAPAPEVTPPIESRPIDLEFQKILSLQGVIPLGNGAFQVPINLWTPARRSKLDVPRNERSLRYRITTKGEMSGTYGSNDSKDTVIYDESVRGSRRPKAPAPKANAAVQRDERVFDADYTGPRWTYGMRNRPVGLGAAPKGYIIGSGGAARGRARNGTIQYPRELTSDELYQFEMELMESPDPAPSATAPAPTPAPEVTADGQRDMLAGRADEPFNLTAESAAERRAREAKELAAANKARQQKEEAARKALEAATPELPMVAIASNPTLQSRIDYGNSLISLFPSLRNLGIRFISVEDSRAEMKSAYDEKVKSGNAIVLDRLIYQTNLRSIQDIQDKKKNAGGMWKRDTLAITLSSETAVSAIAHEVGHAIMDLALDSADESTRSSIRAAYDAWYNERYASGKTPSILDTRRIWEWMRQSDWLNPNAPATAEMRNDAHEKYRASFPEWFADEVAKWAATENRPKSLIDQFFSDVADKIRKLWSQINQYFSPDATVKQYLDSLVGSRDRMDQVTPDKTILGGLATTVTRTATAPATTVEAPQSFADELRASNRNPDKIPAPALASMEAARRGDATAFSKLTPVQKSSVTDVIIRAKDGAAADALGINRREFKRDTQESRGNPPSSQDNTQSVNDRLADRGLDDTNIKVVNSENIPWEGRLMPDGTIELNAARLPTQEDIDRVVDHEIAHLAERDPAMASDIAAMKDAMPADFIAELEDDLRATGYGEDALPSEVTANLAEALNRRFQKVPAWERFIRRIKTWAKQALGMKLNNQDALALAARIIARGMDLATSKGRAQSTQYSLPAKNKSRLVDPEKVMAKTKAGRTVGTRSPSAAKVAGTGSNPELLIDLQSARQDPKLYKKNAILLAGYRMVAGTIPGISDRVLAAQRPLAQMAELVAAKKKEIASIKTALAKEIKNAAKDRGKPLSKDDQKNTAMDKRMRAARGELAKAYRAEVKRGIALTEKLKATQKQVAAQLDDIGKSITMEDADLIYQNTIKATRDNLAKLMELFPEDLRDIAKLWYDGANIIAQQFAGSAGVSLEKASAVLAVFSPQKDWFMNVALAQRTMEIWTNDQDTVFSREMADQYVKRAGEPQRAINKAGEELWMDKEQTIPKFEGGAVPIMEGGEVVGFVWDSAKKEQFIKEQKEDAENMVGKTLREMDQDYQSRFIRMREETKYSRDFPIVSPDGTFGGPKLNENGSPAKLAWGSYVTIDKALSILKAEQSKEQQIISDALGVMHKVRSFYNNIVDPQSRDGHVTMDTHAIAALFWEAMSGNSKAVTQNFGGAGSASSSVLGIKGLYPAFAEAYRTLAAELGLLPRQVQSITWEAIRMLFPAKWKSQKSNVASIESVWDDYRHGEITQEQARERIFLLVQGRPIGSPEGVGRPDWAPLIQRVNNTETASGTADKGKVSGNGRSWDGRAGRLGRPGLSGDTSGVVRGPSNGGLIQDDGSKYSLPIRRRSAAETQAIDADYMAAVESDDVETQQKIIDTEAAKAGFTVKGWNQGPRPIENNEINTPFFYITETPDKIWGDDGTPHDAWFLKPGKVLESEMASGAFINYKAVPAYFQNGEWTQLAKDDDVISVYDMAIDEATDARMMGYDTISEPSEVKDGTRQYIALRPSQIKSAAPVVRDDKGNVIPPSQRFNSASDDIRYSLPSAKTPSLFEKFFGNDKKVTAAAKEFEARNAGRAALSTLLFDGIAPDHQPATAFEDTIATLTTEQRNALHDRVLDNLFRMTGSDEDADAYARELKSHLESVPELAGQRNISMAALQYTNLVTAAGILSGVYGQTAAFSTIIQTDNDQLRFGVDASTLLRSDLGRLLGSQSGIGGRIAEFASIIAKTNQEGLKRIGLTDEQITLLGKAVANKQLTANEFEEIFAASTTSPENASMMGTALAKLQRLVDAAAAKANPPKQPESEIETLWRLMQEARGTKRGAAIAAALKAFMPDGPRNLSKANQAILADFRARMQQQGGENLARSFWQLMSNTPRPAPGSLASFDSATQSMLSDLLKRAVEKAGLAGNTTSLQPDAIQKLVLNLSNDNLRWDKIAAADEAVQAEIEAITDDAQREAVRAAWEDATSDMSFALGGPALMRRALRDQMKDTPPNWKAAFDTGKPMLEAIANDRVTFVDAAMSKIQNALTTDEALSKIPALRAEMEATFNDIAAERYAGWLQGRERIAAQQKTAAARANFMAALKNRGVAESRLNKLAEALSDTPTYNKPGEVNPVTALINAQMKQADPDFVAKMTALGVTSDVAGPLESLIEENRRRAANIDAVTGKPAKLVESILSKAVGPLVAKLPVNQIVRAMMTAPAHHRNSAAWRELQINRWLAEQGIDSALASRLARSMDEVVAGVMANVIYQEQERYVTGKKGVGTQAISNPEFAAKYQDDPAAVREAIRKGLLDDGAPWQAWFSSVTGLPPLSQQVIADIARLESILSGDKYQTSEKGVAAAKLRDLMDEHFGKDATGWEILAASYDASALSSGTTMGIQFSSPLGRLIGTFGADLIGRAFSPGKAADVIDSLMSSMDVYAAELPLAWKYDNAGHTMGNAEQDLSRVAVLRRDLAKYRAILANPNASTADRVQAIPRVLIAAQDFLRQAMNAADSAAAAGFQRYFETREVRRLMRRNNITKAQMQSEMDRNGFFRDQVELQADALGYDGPLKRRFVQDAVWAREKELSRARTDSPEAHAKRMAQLTKAAQQEAQFQIFIGEEKDSPGVTDPVDWALGGLQQIGQGAFRNARERVDAGQTALGSLQRIAARAIFGFVGIPLNAARASIWYSPLAAISWANYLAHKSGKAYKDGNPYARSLGNEIAVRQRIKEGIVGNTIILLGIALAQGLGDDDEDKWQINGYGPDPKKYPDEAKAWQRRHVPFSVEHIGKDGKAEIIPFKKGPLEFINAPLMLLGGANDARLNSKLAKNPVAETRDLVMGAIRQLGLSSITTGMRNAVGIRDSLQQMGQDSRLDQFGSSAGFMVSPVMPWSGTERWIRTWNNPELLERGFNNNLPFAHYRDDARPALNSFGQPIRPAPEITKAIARQTNGVLPGYARTLTPDDNRLYTWMERTGKKPTTYARSELETRVQQSVSDAQWWEYTKASGQVRYEQTLAAIDGTLPLERTIPLRGKDAKRPGPMKKGLADIDADNKQAMKEAGEILKDIGQAAHMAGLKAIGMEEPAKEKPAKKKAPPIY